MYAPQLGADGRRRHPDHPLRPRVPGHRGVRPAAGGAADAARPGQPRLLPHRGRRPDHGRVRARSGAMGAGRRPRRVRGAAAARGLAALRRAAGQLDRAGAGDGDAPRSRSCSTARRRSRRTASSSSASRTCPGSGSPPGSAPTGWRAPGGWAGSWPSGSSRASPASTCGTWTSAASVASTAASATPWSAPPRSTPPTTTSSTPTTSGRRGVRCGSRRPTAAWPSWGRASARSRAGSGPTGSSRTRRTATRRCARAAGRARTGRRRSRPRHGRPARAPALFDESSFAKLEVEGPGALEFLQHLCANDVGKPPGSITYTQMLNRRGGIECDFTVTRLGEQRFRIVTGTAMGNHDLGWIRKHLPAGRQRAAVGRHRRLRLLRPVGAEGARDPAAADQGRPRATRRSAT